MNKTLFSITIYASSPSIPRAYQRVPPSIIVILPNDNYFFLILPYDIHLLQTAGVTPVPAVPGPGETTPEPKGDSAPVTGKSIQLTDGVIQVSGN